MVNVGCCLFDFSLSLDVLLDVSITAHGGIINALLVGMGREHLPLPTGG